MKKNEHICIVTMEECAEIQQDTSKLLRFGKGNHHPDSDVTNGYHLMKEYYQLQAMIEMMVEHGIVDELPEEEIKNIKDNKKLKVNHYINYSRELGLLT